ncbi:MAG: SMC-Scp complex subunit ScpB [Candidatus Heimdallarchaeota archaeon]
MNEFNNETKEELEEDYKNEDETTPEDIIDLISDSKEENKVIDEYLEEDIPYEDLPENLDNSDENTMELGNSTQEEIIKEPITPDENSTTSEISEDIIEGEVFDVEKDEKKSLEAEMREYHRNLIEASLYAAGRPLTIEELSNRLEFPKKEVEELVNEVAFDYLERSTALVIAQIGDRYQMQIKPEYTEKVSKFAKGGAIAERYLRTLTIIALKQPILKSMVIKLRGTGAYEHVKYLLDNGFINAIKKGRSHELTTTDKYADMFGLPKNIQQLKLAMVTQLGIDETSIEQSEVDTREQATNDFEVEDGELPPSESELESELEKEE